MAGSIVVLTGAGISAESGIRTFRDNNGLWEDHRVEDVASPEGFARNPNLVYRFYNERRRQLLSDEVKPNAAHEALARLEKDYPGTVTVITQNVDDLHERAGSERVWHMHGELLKARCQHCSTVLPWHGDLNQNSRCDNCLLEGRLRPHIVWFGEFPLYMDKIDDALQHCGLFVAIGTSGNVYPAAGFVQAARYHRAKTLEINLQASSVSTDFDEAILGAAGQQVPVWVDSVLANCR